MLSSERFSYRLTTNEFIDKAKRIHGEKFDYSLVDYVNSYTKIRIICPIHGVFEQEPRGHLKYGCSECSKNKLTIKEFIKRAIKVHGEKYNYSKFYYNGYNTKGVIICPIHGEFEQMPNNHLSGDGCLKCGNKTLTTEGFVNKAKEIHNNMYDYSLVDYINKSIKIKIICPIHNEFEQKPREHLRGCGCPKCAINNIKLTTEEFIEKAIKIHGYKYDYSLVDYKESKDYIKIICPIHGEFEQIPNGHLNGSNCPQCMIDNLRLTTEEFVEKAIKIHGKKYDYSLVNYENALTKVKIICPIHGEFEQLPLSHCNGNGCLKCGDITTEEFVEKAIKIHGKKYDYSLVNYENALTKVKIICPIHGEFEQKPNNHVNQKNGCRKCGYSVNISKAHQEIIDFIKEDKIINDREIIKPNELDIHIPNKNVAIEFHGVYWHSYNELETKKERHKHHNKASICHDKGIQLIQIFEDEWLNKKEIVKSIINSKLGINNRLYARKCEIKELMSNEFNEFCTKNHIQGKLDTLIRLGLIYDTKLVCAIGFNKHSKYDYECTRFCNELNINVIGGASRLFKYFLNKYKPESILSFADRRYSNGCLYKTLGFELSGVTDPGYFYVKGANRFSRQSFQKHKLEKKLEIFNLVLSESQNMFNNNYRRIWDAGHWKFTYTNENI